MDKEANGPPQLDWDPSANVDEGLSVADDLPDDLIPANDNEENDEENDEEKVGQIVGLEEDETEPAFAHYPADDRPSSGGNPLLLGLTIALVFILGLGLGFFGRPVILEDLPIEVVVTVIPNENQAVAQANTATTAPVNESNPGGGGDEMSSELHNEATAGQPTPTIMDFVLSDARHIQGDEAAPVTIIEFSDFN